MSKLWSVRRTCQNRTLEVRLCFDRWYCETNDIFSLHYQHFSSLNTWFDRTKKNCSSIKNVKVPHLNDILWSSFSYELERTNLELGHFYINKKKRDNFPDDLLSLYILRNLLSVPEHNIFKHKIELLKI